MEIVQTHSLNDLYRLQYRNLLIGQHAGLRHDTETQMHNLTTRIEEHAQPS